MRKNIFILGLLMATMHVAVAQAPTYKLNSSTNGNTITVTSEGAFLYDSGGNEGMYSPNEDFHITFCGTCSFSSYRMGLTVSEFDVDPTDTLYIYDGTSTSDRLLAKGNNDSTMLNKRFYPSINNTSGCLTIRFVSNNDGNRGTGFVIGAACGYPCENSYPVIDDAFYKIAGGTRTRMLIKNDFEIDSVEHGVDTNYFRTIDLCVNDTISLKAAGVYGSDFGYYHPGDATSTFKWMFTENDSVYAVGATEAGFRFTEVKCYTVNLMITDEKNCPSTALEQVRVRVARNPIKTIYPLQTICNRVTLPIDVGYGVNSTINVAPIEFKNEATASYVIPTFIPDGPNCAVQCYRAPVTFDQFPSGKKIESKEDICSICVNMEHEYMGDISIAIVCPNGSQAMLKNQPTTGTCGGGGSSFLGLPYGGNSHHSWDGSGTQTCDSSYNTPGVGWNYCWSLNSEYDNSRGCITSTGLQHQVTYNFPAMSGYSPGTAAGTQTFSTTDSSDYAAKSGYYTPADDFSTLVGCPLNGQWAIEVCDLWASDNGWVFSWSMDLCNIKVSDCEYQVGIDTVIWMETPGVSIVPVAAQTAQLSTPDTAGTFDVGIRIIDDYGCIWDTTTTITTVWTPQPNLGDDLTICDVESVRLDAGDAHSNLPTYSFVWEPTFDSTQVINTPRNPGKTTTYEVEVTNHDEGIFCRTRDTIVVVASPQPVANFVPNVYPIEGCDPFTLKIENTTIGATRYRWEFGDGIISNEKDPKHVYSEGEYQFKFYAVTDNGCKDSLIYPGLVKVYPGPHAEFGWTPEYPEAKSPTIELLNKTTHHGNEVNYFWEIQYDKEEDITVTTIPYEENTSYTWEGDIEKLPGEYLVKLIAAEKNISPTGNVVECRDTMEHKIRIINDYLQFPNAVTPNGDGINDIFEIKNLIDGNGFYNFELSIYDANGHRVYYEKNISEREQFWNPKDMPSGVYFYRFIAKGYNGNIDKTGAIHVLK